MGGIGGGLLGLMAGLAIGKAVDDGAGTARDCDDCIRWGAVAGTGAGTALGMTIGIQRANGSRGRFKSVLGRTAATVAAGWALSYAAYRIGGEGYDMVPAVVGFGSAVYVGVRTEKSTDPARARRP